MHVAIKLSKYPFVLKNFMTQTQVHATLDLWGKVVMAYYELNFAITQSRYDTLVQGSGNVLAKGAMKPTYF